MEDIVLSDLKQEVPIAHKWLENRSKDKVI